MATLIRNGLVLLGCLHTGCASRDPVPSASDDSKRSSSAVAVVSNRSDDGDVSNDPSLEKHANEAEPAGIERESVMVDDVLVELSPSECLVTISRSGRRWSKTLLASTDCHLSKDRQGKIRIEKTEFGKVVVVGSALPTGAGRDCKTYLHGITVTGKEILLSDIPQQPLSCLIDDLDPVMFVSLGGRGKPI